MSSGRAERQRRMGPGPTITTDPADLLQSLQPRVRGRGARKVIFKSRAAAKRITAAQSQCYTTYNNLDPSHKRIQARSDILETTVDSSDSSDDYPTTANDPVKVISVQLQMQELLSISPHCLDSTDKLINLPDELIMEVLSCLDTTGIARMGCLNKMWRSEIQRLTNDEHFQAHLTTQRCCLGASINSIWRMFPPTSRISPFINHMSCCFSIQNPSRLVKFGYYSL